MPDSENSYGTFIGAADPTTGAEDASPLDLLAYALDRFTEDGTDTTLTTAEVYGALSYAHDALLARTVALRNALDGRPEETR